MTTGWFTEWIDASWVDIGSFVTALVFLLVQLYRKKINLSDRDNVLAGLANGFSLFPMLIMFGAFFASKLASELTSASRVTMVIASVAAIYAIVKDSPEASTTG
ncbi:hypothetical protein CEE61_02490 [Stenotrophomonas maltophilia]|uniref:hypothetical protein n=1 Tax=Stenotrophomonas TaxID=40323 RepID=UPI000B4DB04E|nr:MULTISPECIES: hypothetical protein [unclassified Stenotrophomonas]OWQ62683.1 hypothetical protein CEE61_02490 [Stenotrophomonas maltophilia]MRE90770.1 hypothetical protein [Stenotrophomonas sp. M37]MRF23030.1 hypothetical protein [Stenotrophomonas sp. MY18]MRF51218.1 hypothetical protein [Stenotrophomonas sp. MY15]MRG13803.1 hypothetical protein [Stenotrophomonas sp. MY17]